MSKKIAKVILYILATALIVLPVFLGLMTWAFWGTTNGTISSSDTPITESEYKRIFIENDLDSTLFTINITTKYSKDTPLDSAIMPRLGLDPYPLADDTMSFNIDGKSKECILLSILVGDSAAFPQLFNVDIYLRNPSKKNILLKRLNYEEFERYAIPEGIDGEDSFLTANEWTLVLDSAFFKFEK